MLRLSNRDKEHYGPFRSGTFAYKPCRPCQIAASASKCRRMTLASSTTAATSAYWLPLSSRIGCSAIQTHFLHGDLFARAVSEGEVVVQVLPAMYPALGKHRVQLPAVQGTVHQGLSAPYPAGSQHPQQKGPGVGAAWPRGPCARHRRASPGTPSPALQELSCSPATADLG